MLWGCNLFEGFGEVGVKIYIVVDLMRAPHNRAGALIVQLLIVRVVTI